MPKPYLVLGISAIGAGADIPRRQAEMSQMVVMRKAAFERASGETAVHAMVGPSQVLLKELAIMVITRIVANLSAPDPIALAKFYQEVFEFDLPLNMGWISFLTKDSTQKIELHTASEGGSGTELPVI